MNKTTIRAIVLGLIAGVISVAVQKLLHTDSMIITVVIVAVIVTVGLVISEKKS